MDSEKNIEINLYNGKHKKILDDNYGVYAARVEIGQNKYILPPTYKHWYKKYKEFNVRSSDIWVISYPKSGTTWTQELVWCLLNNLEDENAKQFLMKRFPFFEWDGLLPEDTSLMEMNEEDPCSPGVTWKILHTIKDPRPIKSHLHYELLPSNLLSSNAKIIYVSRDPRDVCVSYFFHSVKLDGFTGQFSEFFDLFLKDLHFYSPYWKNVLEFWKMRNHPNVLFITYEELQEDLPKMIEMIAKFIGKCVNKVYLDKLSKHLSFSSMSTNTAVNNESLASANPSQKDQIKFMRKGKVGDWKNYFTKEQTEAFKKWTENNLKETDFPYYQDY